MEPTFANEALSNETPKHVGAMVAIGRLVECLLGEVVSMARVIIDRLAHGGQLLGARLLPFGHLDVGYAFFHVRKEGGGRR